MLLFVTAVLASEIRLRDGRRYDVAELGNCTVTRSATWQLMLDKADGNHDYCVSKNELANFAQRHATVWKQAADVAAAIWSDALGRNVSATDPAGLIEACDESGDGRICVKDMIAPGPDCLGTCETLKKVHARFV